SGITGGATPGMGTWGLPRLMAAVSMAAATASGAHLGHGSRDGGGVVGVPLAEVPDRLGGERRLRRS
ncbi:MAG: hypothetical protein J2P27_02850, partial [Actinobacteria bacterium]|nr:hypothetical protein [Actinomycetota bacterium]